MSLSTDGNACPTLHFTDLNDPDRVSGYCVYRASDPRLDRSLWPQVASNVTDEDGSTPNVQWTDTSGDFSSSGSTTCASRWPAA